MSTTCSCGGQIIPVVIDDATPPRIVHASPDPAGRIAAYRNELGVVHGRQLGEQDEPYGYERRYSPHLCAVHPQADPGNQNVTSLTRWRKAQSQHSATKRRQRSRPRSKPITGIRIPPPGEQ